MIHTSKQLKDKVRNLSHSDTKIAQGLIRNFIMERFLERVSVSKYHAQFILKGGMLVASFIGVDLRSTMDVDATVKALSLTENDAKSIVQEIMDIPMEDGITFEIVSCKEIMSDFEYPGVRMMIEARLDRLRQQFKIDISTDDVITPSAIEYDYKLMFEDRTIRVMTYNLETLLSEKLQTVLQRDVANTRMRDFYDLFYLLKEQKNRIDNQVLRSAYDATCRKRETMFQKDDTLFILRRLEEDFEMQNRWKKFCKDNYFVRELEWLDVIRAVRCLLDFIYLLNP